MNNSSFTTANYSIIPEALGLYVTIIFVIDRLHVCMIGSSEICMYRYKKNA